MFLNGQQIHSEWEKKERKQKHRSDSIWFLHHLDPILRNDFSCRSESTRVVYHGVTSSFSGIGILPVSDLLGSRYFRSVLIGV